MSSGGSYFNVISSRNFKSLVGVVQVINKKNTMILGDRGGIFCVFFLVNLTSCWMNYFFKLKSAYIRSRANGCNFQGTRELHNFSSYMKCDPAPMRRYIYIYIYI